MEERFVINWISSTLQQSNTPVRHQSEKELLVEQSSLLPGYESRTPVEHSSSMHRESTVLVEHSSSTPVNRWSEPPVEQFGLTPGSETESTVEHFSLIPTKCAELNLEVLAAVLMEHLSDTKTANKATQVPEKQPHVCFMWPRGYGTCLSSATYVIVS